MGTQHRTKAGSALYWILPSACSRDSQGICYDNAAVNEIDGGEMSATLAKQTFQKL
jgi:hypothetical protein